MAKNFTLLFPHFLGVTCSAIIVVISYFAFGYNEPRKAFVDKVPSSTLVYEMYDPRDAWHVAVVASAKAIDRIPGIIVAYDYENACAVLNESRIWPSSLALGTISNGSNSQYLIQAPKLTDEVNGTDTGSFDLCSSSYKNAIELAGVGTPYLYTSEGADQAYFNSVGIRPNYVGLVAGNLFQTGSGSSEVGNIDVPDEAAVEAVKKKQSSSPP
jgi:hypothetical protein